MLGARSSSRRGVRRPARPGRSRRRRGRDARGPVDLGEAFELSAALVGIGLASSCSACSSTRTRASREQGGLSGSPGRRATSHAREPRSTSTACSTRSGSRVLRRHIAVARTVLVSWRDALDDATAAHRGPRAVGGLGGVGPARSRADAAAVGRSRGGRRRARNRDGVPAGRRRRAAPSTGRRSSRRPPQTRRSGRGSRSASARRRRLRDRDGAAAAGVSERVIQHRRGRRLRALRRPHLRLLRDPDRLGEGLLAALRAAPPDTERVDGETLSEAYARHEAAAERPPYRPYREVLAAARGGASPRTSGSSWRRTRSRRSRRASATGRRFPTRGTRCARSRSASGSG